MEKKSVLVVDDEIVFCKSLSTFLRNNGYDVSYATDGNRALELIEKERPDIMTLDLCMPGDSRMLAVNGLEVLAKAPKIHERIRIIVLSATDIIDTSSPGKMMGANAVHRKPIDLNELLDTIKKLLAERA